MKSITKSNLKNKLKQLLLNLNSGLIGKEDTIKLSLLSILAQENILLFGPPGTAKSEISKRISNIIESGSYFEYLLTKFTTPEEIFGPLSIKELKQDRFHRKTDGYLPTVHNAFLDEIFKANSSILNTLLTIINEKTFHNGNCKEKINLISLIAASNEYPHDDLELNALYDRFLIRKIVNYVSDNDINKFFDITNKTFKINENLKITMKELQDIEDGTLKISIPFEIREIIKNIRLSIKEKFKENKQENISDRKFIKILKLLKVSAYTNNRESIDLSDLILLINCLWNNPENKDIITEIIIQNIKNGCEEFYSNKNIIFTEENNEYIFKGEGTKNNPFLIENENDLKYLSKKEYIDKNYYFKQVNNIEIIEVWNSIGNDDNVFQGTYDGNNQIISKLNKPLFYKTKNSNIKNIILKEININMSLKFIGGLVNETYNTTISNSSIEGFISSDSYAGGVIGYNDLGHISNCKIEGFISSDSYAGGIIGYSKSGNISNCEVKGTISSDSYAGGVIGYSESGNISNCEVEATISSYNDNEKFCKSYAGGVIGYSEEGHISNCKVNGHILSNSSSGGIIGSREISILFKNYIDTQCIFKENNIIIQKKNSDANSIDGKVLNSSLFTKKFYEELKWNFNSIWDWDWDKNKPILKKNKNIKKEINLQNMLNNNIWISVTL